MEFIFQNKQFSSLNIEELYDIMRLRQEVFVVEQNCPYLDADGKDQVAYHISVYEIENLAAYARILPKGEIYENYISIGRVLTAASHRRKKLGKQLMEYTLDQCQLIFPDIDIKISAQSYLLNFYREFNFEDIGKEYLEDGIPHKAMIRKSL